MRFGNQTITFKHLQKVGDPDEYGNYQMEEVETAAPFCRHRPLAFSEVVDLGLDVATEWWKSTVPVHEYNDTVRGVVMSAAAIDIIACDGQDYQIFGGVRTHPGAHGDPFKTTIISQKHVG